ncbi:MAG TPA: preprotein translocase subunit SecG [Candidatus Acidoferrum sp.]|nr:preprotein translocase subunit SecG [Candidatus Acidoferrum sp.]
MLGFFIGLLTVVMVLVCAFLILLVLVQLPKKEAGMGQAFGGAATDALFGAGSGNALTKMTKWAAGIFFVLAILLTVLSNYRSGSTGGSRLQDLMNKAPAPVPPPTLPATPPPTTTTGINIVVPTNVPAVGTPAPSVTTPVPAPAK